MHGIDLLLLQTDTLFEDSLLLLHLVNLRTILILLGKKVRVTIFQFLYFLFEIACQLLQLFDLTISKLLLLSFIPAFLLFSVKLSLKYGHLLSEVLVVFFLFIKSGLDYTLLLSNHRFLIKDLLGFEFCFSHLAFKIRNLPSSIIELLILLINLSLKFRNLFIQSALLVNFAILEIFDYV